MFDYSDIGKTIISEFDEPYIVATKEMLVKRICELKSNEGFDWADVDNDGIGTAYRIDKLNWTDSVMVLIGGYGGITESCYLDDETFNGKCSSCDADSIVNAVNQFYIERCIDKSEIILIANGKNIGIQELISKN